MRLKLLIIISLIGAIFQVSGQKFFQTNTPLEKNINGLFLKFENASFFKNNEYQSNNVKGYTLTGYWLRPKLIYVPSGKAQFEFGWHHLRYNGKDKAVWNNPWFSVLINTSKKSKLILGNLNNSLNHNLISPLWEPERFLTDKPEAGFQYLYKSDKTQIDTWLNWEQFIQKKDPFQEHFTAGFVSKHRVINTSKIRISLPLQILVHHRGGEIDSSPLKVQTLLNFVFGIQEEIPLSGFIRQFKFNSYYLFFYDSKGNAGLPFDNGSGMFSSILSETAIGNFGINYWSSKNFFAEKGMQLFQTISELNESTDNTEHQKKLISVNYSLKKEIQKGIILGAQLEGWCEINKGNFSNSAAMYIIINQDRLLKQH